jgi:hypothetical protein
VQSSFQFYIALIWDANLTEDKEKVKLSQSVNSLRQNIHKNFFNTLYNKHKNIREGKPRLRRQTSSPEMGSVTGSPAGA